MRRLTPLVALLASWLVISGCGVPDPYQGATATTPAAVTTTMTGTATTPASSSSSNDADEVQPDLSPALRDAQRGGLRAARTFLAGYLPYSYAQAHVASPRAATPALRRELLRRPPRVSKTLSTSARPRVLSLRASGVSRNRVYLIAQITDGQTSYATTLTAQRSGNRWLISEVQ